MLAMTVKWLRLVVVGVVAAGVGFASPVWAAKADLTPVRAALEVKDYDKALSLIQPLIAAGESSGEAYYLLGSAQMGKGNWTEAETSLNQAREKRYQEPEALLALAQVLIRLDRPAEVEPLLTKPLGKAKDPKQAAAYKHMLGQAALTQGKYSEAQEWLLGARVDDEDNLVYRLALGEAYFRGQVYPLAASEYEAILAADSSRVDVMYRLAETYYQLRRLSDAKLLLVKVLERDSTYHEAYFKLANIYMIAAQSRPGPEAQAMYKAALSLYLKVRDVDPKADPILVAKNIATVYYLLNAHDSAIVELQRAKQTGAKDPELNFFLGRSNMLLGHYQEAITAFVDYRQARETADPPQPWVVADAELFWRTAMCMEALKDSALLPQIADNYRRAAELDPNDDRSIGGLALTLHKLGRYTEAAVEFEKLVVRYPNDARTLFNAALPYLQSDNNEKAVEYLMRSAASDTSAEAAFRSKAYKLAGPRLIKMQRIPEAQTAYKWLMDREPNVCEHMQWYGFTYFSQKNYSAAVPALRRAIKCWEATGENPCRCNEPRWWLAYALYETGEKDESYKTCEKVVQCDPKHADAKKLMDRIDDEIVEKK
jgi:tetratricopeptide (TPR) repeat protein